MPELVQILFLMLVVIILISTLTKVTCELQCYDLEVRGPWKKKTHAKILNIHFY